jgi:hypothetical protein
VTQAQLASTLSFQQRSLKGVNLRNVAIPGADLSEFDLSDADLTSADVHLVNFNEANIRGASLSDTTARGFTEIQLQSTESYRENDLSGVRFALNDMRGWSFAGIDLTDAEFFRANLRLANFRDAELQSARFSLADLEFADFRGAKNAQLDERASSSDPIWPDGSVSHFYIEPGDSFTLENHVLPIRAISGLYIPPNATLAVEFDGSDWGSTITTIAAQTLTTILGNLHLQFAPGVDRNDLIGNKFDLFDWGMPLRNQDRFAKITGDPSLAWDTSELYTSGEVTFLGLAGDTNQDQIVNIQDLNNVRNNFGGVGLGDTDGNGNVDIQDLNAVRNNFGNSLGAQPVPEPATVPLLAIAAAALAFAKRRSIWRRRRLSS